MSLPPALSVLEEQLRCDSNGRLKKNLQEQLAAALYDIRRKTDAGVTTEHYLNLCALKQALESATRVIDKHWNFFHQHPNGG